MPRRIVIVASMTAILIVGVATGGAAIPGGRIGIGDSVMRGAKPNLESRGFRVNTATSRQFSALPGLMRQIKAAGKLRRKVVVHLGNNGYLDRADCGAASEVAGPDRHLFLVTLKVPRQWRSVNNERLRACARAHANTSLIDWYGVSIDHPGWFADDGYHLTPTGAREYAALLDRRTS